MSDRPSTEVMQACADGVLSLQDVVGHHFWFCPRYRKPSSDWTPCTCGMDALHVSRARARAEIDEERRTVKALIGDDTEERVAEIRREIKRLSALWSQAHYGDDDVRASEIRCQIDELQAELDR